MNQRVTYINPNAETETGEYLHGMRGIAIASRPCPSRPDQTQYLVQFEDDISDVGGHSGNGIGRAARCLWITEHHLRFANRPGTQSVREQNCGATTPRKEKGMSFSLPSAVRKMLDKDLRVLVEEGLLDNNLEPTEEGVMYAVADFLTANKKTVAADLRKERKNAARRRKGEDEEE